LIPGAAIAQAARELTAKEKPGQARFFSCDSGKSSVVDAAFEPAVPAYDPCQPEHVGSRPLWL
jgi:hypothetical protein